jgi:hypothetical protein
VQKEVASAAGAGPGRLVVLIAIGRVQAGQFFVADVVETAVEVADAAEVAVGRTRYRQVKDIWSPSRGARREGLRSARFVTSVKT